MEIIFLFYADPKVVGTDKIKFGNRTRKNDFEELKSFCSKLLGGVGIKADDLSVSMSPKSMTQINFGDGNFVSPAFEAELVYYSY